jgi:hypothetical protein
MSEENITKFYVHLPVSDVSETATVELVNWAQSMKAEMLRSDFESLPTRFEPPDVIILTFKRDHRIVRIYLRPV